LTLDDSLGVGVTTLCRDGRPITYRFLSGTDDLDLITELLHRGYARLAEAGLRFVASHQEVEVTRRRLAKGETVVALDRSRLVGIVTLARADATSGSPFYDRPDVASCGQYAVEPTDQGNGIGTTLLEYVERLALLRGVKTLALARCELPQRRAGKIDCTQHDWPSNSAWSRRDWCGRMPSVSRAAQAAR
jgi:GNAT superfamily N-acetyltransferase